MTILLFVSVLVAAVAFTALVAVALTNASRVDDAQRFPPKQT